MLTGSDEPCGLELASPHVCLNVKLIKLLVILTHLFCISSNLASKLRLGPTRSLKAFFSKLFTHLENNTLLPDERVDLAMQIISN